MSIENLEVVDFIGTDKVTGRTILTISDHLEWSDENKHFDLVEKKVGTYINFVESGQLVENRAESTDKPLEIRLVCQWEPSAKGINFLEAVRKSLEERGFAFSWKVLSAK